MNDDEIQDLLRRVRPPGPRPALRARIVRSASPRRAWPWAAAAAALLVATVALHGSATRSAANSVALTTSDEEVLSTLTDMLGGDADARTRAELILAADEIRMAANNSNSTPEATPESR